MPKSHKTSHSAARGWNPNGRHVLSGRPGGTAALVAVLNFLQATHRAELNSTQRRAAEDAEARLVTHAKAARAGLRSLRWIGEQDTAETWIRLFGRAPARRHARYVKALAVVDETAREWLLVNAPPERRRAARRGAPPDSRAVTMAGAPVTLREALMPVRQRFNLDWGQLADYVLDVAVTLPADAQRRLLELPADEPTYQPHERDIAAALRKRVHSRLKAPSRRKR